MTFMTTKYKYLKKDQKNQAFNFRFIDLFAGIGGFRIPFQDLGGDCVFSSEWDKYSQKTYKENFGEVPYGDITEIASSKIPDHEILCAGFPCQAFSSAGKKKGFEDTRGTLFFEIQRILSHKRPKAFILENVKRLKTHRGADGRKTFEVMSDILEGKASSKNINEIKDLDITDEARKSLDIPLNYSIAYKVLSPSDYGIPQNRERLFIIGIDRDNFLPDGVETCDLFHWPTKWGLESRLGSILEHNLTEEDKNKCSISEKLWNSHKERKKRNKERGYGFGYALYKPSDKKIGTLSARYYKDGSEALIDRGVDKKGNLKTPRKLTPRECARLQGFPEDFKVCSSRNQAYKQFGNAVNVRVVRLLAENLLLLIREVENIKNFSKSGLVMNIEDQKVLDFNGRD